MSDLLVCKLASINTIPESTKIHLSSENEIKEDNRILESQISEIPNDVENINILHDKISKFNNSELVLNQEPPVDSPSKTVENTKENVDNKLEVEHTNKNSQLRIMDSDSEDDHLINITDKDATDLVKSAGDTNYSEITTEEDINQKKRLAIMNNDSEDDSLNKMIEKDTTNVIHIVDNEEITVLSVEKGKRQRKRLTVINSDSEDHSENIADIEEDGLTKVGNDKSDNEKKKERKRFSVFNSDDSDSENDKDETIAHQEDTGVSLAVEHRAEDPTKLDTTGGENKKRKRLTIINSDDSESEHENEETIAHQEGSKVPSTVEHLAEETTKLDSTGGENKKRKRLTIINSDDSESENENVETIAHQEGSKVPSTAEHLAEEIIEERTVEVPVEEKKKSRLMQICDSDSDDESINVNKSTTLYSENIFDDNNERATRLQNLCDAESSAEEEESQKINHIQISKGKKTVKTPKDKELLEKPMTGRDAMEQRRQIKSESQKMCRETHVSLPYHRPKQHTLQDFLKRRSLMNNIIKVPPNTPTSFAIKMSAQEFKKTAEQLKEREKNIELFYKSESEEEEECEEQVTKDDDKMEEVSQKEIEEVVHPVEEEKSLECVVDGTEKEKIEKEVVEMEKEVIQETEKLTEDFVADKDISFAEDEEIESIQTKITEVIDSFDDIVTEEDKENTEIDKSDDEDLENGEKDKEEKLEELRVVLKENLGPINQTIGKKLKEPTYEELLPSSILPPPVEPQNKITPEKEKENKSGKKLNEPTFEELLSSSILPPPVEPQKKITPEEEKENKIEERLKKLNPLISLKRFSEPIRLSGNANEIIVLDEGVDRSKNVSHLMKRFFIHTAKKQIQKKTEISVLNADGSGRHHETILVTEDVEEPAKKHQIPGLRMKKLREELQEQIKQKRLEEYMKKKAEYKLDNEEGDDSPYVAEKTDCGLDDEILDNDDEEEFTDEDISSEEEEDDVELKETPRVKSAFVDEEAEESDMEDQVDDVVEDDEAEDELEEHLDLESQTPKTLKRIIQTLDDSDDENVDENAENIEENQEKICDNVEASQPQSTWDEFDGEITAYQPRNGLEKTPCKPLTQNEQDISCFLSPTLNLTALQGRKLGDSTIIEESPKIVLSVPPKPSPLKDHPFLKTRLFSQNSENVDEFDELAALCSGKFPSPKKNIESAGLSTQEQSLLDICSGTFSGLEQSNNEERTIEDSKECSTSKGEATQSSAKPFDARNFNYPKFKICSSSDEETVPQGENKTKKLKKKRRFVIDDISLSDDEEEDKENDFDDLILEEGDEDDEERQNINYDSEENEVDEETEQIAKKKAREFFEAEAELSGSEWGSEDEDEKGLDDFEVEDADGEKINEKKVQQELERMHIRNVLDDDQRDIRLLQEMLLEDGELHGEGREKKFKWKNTASLTWNEDNAPKDEDEEVEDIESEQQWRKMRHEREAFLHEQKMKAQLEDDEDFAGSDSQFLKLGQMALQKSMESSQMKTTVTETIVKMDDIKLPFNLNNKRGSFLARSETTLARLAEITRTTGGINNGPKNSRNFVFTAIEKTEKSTTYVENDKKRKAEETVPKVPKKIRIAKPKS